MNSSRLVAVWSIRITDFPRFQIGEHLVPFVLEEKRLAPVRHDNPVAGLHLQFGHCCLQGACIVEDAMHAPIVQPAGLISIFFVTLGADFGALTARIPLAMLASILAGSVSRRSEIARKKEPSLRDYRTDGRMAGDVLSIEGDRYAGAPLLQPVMKRDLVETAGPALSTTRQAVTRP
jgi:hypothetical protein